MRAFGLFKILLIGLLIKPVPGFAMDQQTEQPGQQTPPTLPKVNPDDLKHGAVLCSWSIFMALAAISDSCPVHKDEKLRAVLNHEIARIDKFIMANEPATRDELEMLRLRLTFVPSDGPMCTDDSRKFYENFYEVTHRAGLDEIHRGVTDLLSVPRKPVLNPCL